MLPARLICRSWRIPRLVIAVADPAAQQKMDETRRGRLHVVSLSMHTRLNQELCRRLERHLCVHNPPKSQVSALLSGKHSCSRSPTNHAQPHLQERRWLVRDADTVKGLVAALECHVVSDEAQMPQVYSNAIDAKHVPNLLHDGGASSLNTIMPVASHENHDQRNATHTCSPCPHTCVTSTWHQCRWYQGC